MKFDNIYFLGIGGIGMSAIARYFLHAGKRVAGYDRTRTPLTARLEREGARIEYRDGAEFINPEFRDPADTLVVYTPAVPDGHPQMEWFRANGFRIEKRSEMLGHIAEGRYVMAVAGTHGKTTVTTLTAWLNHVAAADGRGGNGSACGGGDTFRGVVSETACGEGDLLPGVGESVCGEGSRGGSVDMDSCGESSHGVGVGVDSFDESSRGGSAFLGGISKNFDSNLVLGGGRRLAVEADEFDRSFLRLYPDVAVITSVDPDHLDIYGDHAAMKEAFRQFASQIKPGGALILKYDIELPAGVRSGVATGVATVVNAETSGANPGTTNVNAETSGANPGTTNANAETSGANPGVTDCAVTVYRYSLDRPCDFYAANITLREGGYYDFDLHFPDRVVNGCTLGVPGLVNVENAVAAAAMMWVAGFDGERLKCALKSFRGVKRRFEFWINTPQLVYIDDYAHHPRELTAAITSIRGMFPGRRMTAVFQPHLYTRTRDFYREFGEALSLADDVVLVPIYPAREAPIAGITSEIIGEYVTVPWRVASKEDVADALAARGDLDVVVTFGAGDIENYCAEIAEKLNMKHT